MRCSLAFALLLSACSSRVALTIAGDGSGEVVGARSSCRFSCDLEGPLRATADAHSRFEGWSGACSGTGECRNSGNVAATFTTTEFPLGFTRVGEGTVRLDADALEQGSVWVRRDTTVTLVATPADGWVFSRWEAPCVSKPAPERCELLVANALEVTAIFERTFELTLVVEGAGEVIGPAPIGTCSSRCSARLRTGSRLSLSTTAMPGHGFAEWVNGCGTQRLCDLTVNQDVVVTARFHPDIAVTTSGDGVGTISGVPGCGGTSCSLPWGPGRTYQLRGVAGDNSRFVGFVGCPDVRGAFCVVSQFTPSLQLVFEKVIVDSLLASPVVDGRLVSTPEAEFVWFRGDFLSSFGGVALDGGIDGWVLFQTRPGPIRELGIPGSDGELRFAAPQQDGGMAFVVRALRPMRLRGLPLDEFSEAIVSMSPSGVFEWAVVNPGPSSDINGLRTNHTTGQTYLLGGLRPLGLPVTYGATTIEPDLDGGSGTRNYIASIDRHGRREWAAQRFDGPQGSLFSVAAGPVALDRVTDPIGTTPCTPFWSPMPGFPAAATWSFYSPQGTCQRSGLTPMSPAPGGGIQDVRFTAVSDGPGTGVSMVGYSDVPMPWWQTALPGGNFYVQLEGAGPPVVHRLATCSGAELSFVEPVGPTTVMIAGNGTCIPEIEVTPGDFGALVLIYDRQARGVVRGWRLPKTELRSIAKLNDREFRLLVTFVGPRRIGDALYPSGRHGLVFTLRL